MLKKATPLVLSVALSLGASNALAGQSVVNPQKAIPPAVKDQPARQVSKSTTPAPAAGNPQAVKAAKKIELTKERAIIQRKGPGHVA